MIRQTHLIGKIILFLVNVCCFPPSSVWAETMGTRRCCPSLQTLREDLTGCEDLGDPEVRPLGPGGGDQDYGLPVCSSGHLRRILVQYEDADLLQDLEDKCLDVQQEGGSSLTFLVVCGNQISRVGTFAKCCGKNEVFDETSLSCKGGKQIKQDMSM